MLTILFFALFFGVFGKLLSFSIHAAWGITKVLLYIVFFPVVLIGLFLAGFVYLAFPLLIVAGILALINMAVD